MLAARAPLRLIRCSRSLLYSISRRSPRTDRVRVAGGDSASRTTRGRRPGCGGRRRSWDGVLDEEAVAGRADGVDSEQMPSGRTAAGRSTDLSKISPYVAARRSMERSGGCVGLARRASSSRTKLRQNHLVLDPYRERATRCSELKSDRSEGRPLTATIFDACGPGRRASISGLTGSSHPAPQLDSAEPVQEWGEGVGTSPGTSPAWGVWSGTARRTATAP